MSNDLPNAPPAPDTRHAPLMFPAAAFFVLLAAILFAIRIASPSNLMDQDQERPAAYAMDALQNGEWIVQTDQSGDITSKPPLYTWLAALSGAVIGGGRLTESTLYLPCLAAVLFTTLLVLWAGTRAFGSSAGILAAFAFLCSMPGLKMIALARTDTVFTAMVAAGSLGAFAAWRYGWNWIWFYAAVTAATMTKGPLGIVLALCGLAGIVTGSSTRVARKRRAVQHTAGIILLLGICGGWFALACWHGGPAVWHKLIGDELVRQAIEGDSGQSPLEGVYMPTLYFISRYLPWSLFALAGIWSVARRPAADPLARAAERFCAAGLIVGLLLFSFAGHKRADHIFPMLPFAALLAGRELAWLGSLGNPRRALAACAGAGVAILVSVGVYYNIFRAGGKHVLRSEGMKELAARITEAGGFQFPITYCRAPYALQFYRNEMRDNVTDDMAQEMLNGKTPVFVAVRDVARIDDFISTTLCTVVARWPQTGTPFVAILSNQPALEWTETVAIAFGETRAVMRNATVERLRPGAIHFGVRDAAEPASVRVTNTSIAPMALSLHLEGASTPAQARGLLAPGDTLSLGSAGAKN